MKKYDRKHIEKLMDYLLSSRDFKTLKTNYQDSIKKFPESIMLKRTYGRRLETLKKDPEALVVIKEVVSDYLFHISKNPDDSEIKYDLALYYHHTIKDYEKAIEIYKSLIYKRHNFHDYQNIYLLYHKLHLCYSFLKNNESAIKSLKQSNIILTEMLNENYDLELKNRIGDNYKSIGHIYRINNNKELINNYLKSIEYNPSLTSWYSAIGNYYLILNDFENYKKYYNLYIENDDFYSWYSFGRRKLKIITRDLKSYIISLCYNGFEDESVSICKKIIKSEHHDTEFTLLFSHVFKYWVLKQKLSKTELKKEIAYKNSKFKELNKKLNNFCSIKPDVLLSETPLKSIYNKYYRDHLMISKSEKELIIRAMNLLHNDLILVSDLFKRSPYIIFKEICKTKP